MSRIFAIAFIALRSSIRSRIVLLLLAILLLVVIGLPLTVRSDGTMAGHVQIVLGYTLGSVFVILALAIVWAGCAAVSTEVQGRQLQLVVTKPVHAAQIWLGKWLGLLILNGVLLALAGAVIYGLLLWTTRDSVTTATDRIALREELLVARRPIDPTLPDIDTPARARLEELQRQQALPPDVSPTLAFDSIRHTMLADYFTVRPGAKREWIFDAPPGLNRKSSILFRMRFNSSDVGFSPVDGVWRVRCENGPEVFMKRDARVPGGTQTLLIPAGSLPADGRVIVEYQNLNGSITVLFDPENGIQLLAHAGTFEGNLLRTLLVIFVRLAFLAALGVTAGSLFSMPVAAFVSLCLLLLIQLGGYMQTAANEDLVFQSHHDAPHPPTARDIFYRRLFKAMNVVVGPLQGPDTLEPLSSGVMINVSSVARVFAVQGLLYTGVLLVVGSWILSRREVALPSD
ncbi:MAG TPA: hypothetical protein PLE77_14150 [Kiritimatiellia bacterium]|nr:hypothetical protein [Kiritimatiellia bacterium]